MSHTHPLNTVARPISDTRPQRLTTPRVAPSVNGQVPFLVLEGDMLRMPHSNTETSSAEEEKRLKLALLPFDPPLCFCVANRAREPTAWDNAQATPFHNYRIDRPGAFVLVDGALRPMDEAILFSGEEHPE